MKFFNKYKKASLVLVIFLFPYFVFAQTEKCSSVGYTIFTINGINTKKDQASDNRRVLERELNLNNFNNQPVTVDFLYNPTHTLGLDTLDAITQKYFDQNNYDIRDSDFVQILHDASQKLNTQKVLIVGHSQGNFYANTFYDAVADVSGGIPSNSIGVYGIASPANRVAGNGLYLTSDTDKVIANIVAHTPLTNILKPNIHIDLKNKNDDILGHSFSDVYMNYAGDRIVSDIKSSLEKLKNNDIQKEDFSCINPPDITLAQKIQGFVLNTIDDTVYGVNNTINTSIYAYNNILDFLGQKYLAFINGAGNILVKVLANAIDILTAPPVSKNNVVVNDNNKENISENNIENKKTIDNTPSLVISLNNETQQNNLNINNNTNTNVVPIDNTLVSVPLVTPSSIVNSINMQTIEPPKNVLGGGGSIVIADFSNNDQNNQIDPIMPAVNPPVPPTPPPLPTPAHVYAYIYAPKYTFGTGNGDGRNWQVWSFNGSNIYDWTSSYVDHYLHEEFKLQTYPGGFYCSLCLEHGLFRNDPRLGFDRAEIRNLEGAIQGMGNGITYNLVLQWDATGYTHTFSHDSIIDYTLHTDVPNVDGTLWEGWDVSLSNFQLMYPEGAWQGVPYLSPDNRNGGSYMVLTPYPVYIP